ncbi:helix-turn-helix domain-containing protein [Streptomyces roseirectus]|uniref:Helix-turn-helix domain-containing protein n=1 Tax=Streptomyces roseirectus TaxID=2768066 RepID=A0A7H0IHV7_9ACTN|nr:helix-turn-helix transcriptional regulator [Streptomyces roseirectus]QNP72373.1 helix-turn-helix domain-containing protein [Streptomyces roseirectus]
MGTPLGDFVRARRDAVQPGELGLPERGRRRSPGLRRSDLAARAGVSVEYLTRLEQGRDRNPSPAVVNALADALRLDRAERAHLRYLTKITAGTCPSHPQPAPAPREVRPAVLATLRLLEPGVAMVTNRLGDVLAHTPAFAALTAGTGLLDADAPNLTRYVFTDPRARALFPDWDDVADEQAFDLWLGPSASAFAWSTETLVPDAGEALAGRLDRHVVPHRGPLHLAHPSGPTLRLTRQTLELPDDAQQLVVFLPADEPTERALADLLHKAGQQPERRLRAIS